MEELKTISVKAPISLYEKVSVASEKLRMSRTNFCEMSLEFVLRSMKRGELVPVNGELVRPAVEVAA